ncbi:MAG: helix-turn-helix domain-containing protein [Nocardioidaceae bacterium]|nr:helix-turn-helix domain-containing protein [Nocardioidaceae bacterium]
MPRSDPHFDPEALRRARTDKGLTQHELARLIGIAGGERVSRWELGATVPRPEALRRIAEVLETDTAELLLPIDHRPDLARLRILAGMSANELARQTHISLTTIRRWEAGNFGQLPAREALRPAAEALGVAVADVEQALRQARAKRL